MSDTVRSFKDRVKAACCTIKQGLSFRYIGLIIILSLTLVLAMAVFYYTDMMDTLENSVMLYQAIKHGQFRQFYTYSLENSPAVFASNYELPIYLLFMVWNLPTVIAADHGFSYTVSIKSILWCKCLLVFALFVCVFFMWKILSAVFERRLDLQERTVIALALFASPIVFLSVFVACQYDCISFAFMLAGVYCYLKGNQFWFLILFYLAFPLKSFSVFLFIPLLMFQDKNIPRLILKLGGMFVLPFCFGILFSGDPSYTFLLKSQSADAIGLITGANITMGAIRINLFMAVYLLICFACYIQPYDKHKVIYFCAWVYVGFVLFVQIRSYWMFLAEPFIILMIAERPEKARANHLIHMVGAIAGSMFFLYSHWIYNTNRNVSFLLFDRLFQKPAIQAFGTTAAMVDDYGLDAYIPLLRTVFIVSFLLLMILNSSDQLWGNSCRFPRWISLSFQVCSIIIIFTMMFTAEYKADKEPALDTLISDTAKAALVEGNDVAAGILFEQPFLIKEQREVDSIWIECSTTSTSRAGRGRICLMIIDSNDQTISKKIIGSSILKTGINKIAIDSTLLMPGEYRLTIQGLTEPRGPAVFIFHAPFLNDGILPARINGETAEWPLCIKIK